MELSSILISLVFMLGATALCVILVERLGLGSVLSFIIAGIIIGPHTPGPVASIHCHGIRRQQRDVRGALLDRKSPEGHRPSQKPGSAGDFGKPFTKTTSNSPFPSETCTFDSLPNALSA